MSESFMDTQPQFTVCETCGGQGEIAVGEVSREMARDAGDMQLEGQIVTGNCPTCGGDGRVFVGYA